MKVLIKLRATRRHRALQEEFSFDDEVALWLHIGKHLTGVPVYVSGTGAVIVVGRLGIAGFVTPLDEESREFYQPLTVVKKAG